MTINELKSDFMEQLHCPSQFQQLFGYLPDVYFFAKNRNGKFIMANDLFIQKCGATSETELLGKTDFDFFPTDKAKSYTDDDQRVMATGEPIVNRVELAPENESSANWFVTSKVPLYSKTGAIIGVAGISRDIARASLILKPYAEMAKVVEYIDENYPLNLDIAKLASISNLSVSQFERKFKAIFQTSPVKHILNVRIKVASKMLAETNRTISTIAQECGFYDHSHFTKQFTKVIKISPSKYRKDNKR